MRMDILNRLSNPFQNAQQNRSANAQQSHENIQQAQKEALIQKNYSEIYAHEQAHKSAGGSLAGGIVIERNQDGIPIGGHVNIKMPTLNPQDPQKTIDDANTVIRAAMAPSDPSGQDYAVASSAQSIKMRAQALKSEHQGKKLDTMA